jgi:ketosteroid isomerase-like protein
MSSTSDKPPFQDPRHEMIAARVQQHGDVALLSFNLVQYGKLSGPTETVLAQWNTTEEYRRIAGEWKIIHSHWSFTRPELTQPGS